MPNRGHAVDWFLSPSRLALLAMAAVLFACDRALLHMGDGTWTAGPVDETAHFLTGALVVAALRGRVGRSFAIGLLTASVLIDLDHVPGRLGIDWITRGTDRPYTHSLLTIAVLTLAAVVWRSRRSLLLGVILGLAFHFFRDTSESTVGGVPLFWPWEYHSYASPHWSYLVVMGAVLGVALYRARPERAESALVRAARPEATG